VAVVGVRDRGLLLHHLNLLCLQLGVTGTVVIAVYDPDTRLLPWAGHMAPLIGGSGCSIDLDPPPGLLLGADPEAGYPVATTGAYPGDLVLFCAGQPLITWTDAESAYRAWQRCSAGRPCDYTALG
jgi:hypothetical protein